MSISELMIKVSNGKRTGQDVLPFEVAMNFRMSYPLAAFLVSFQEFYLYIGKHVLLTL